MLNVYRVRVNIQKFQCFQTSNAEFLSSVFLKIHGEEIEEEWYDPKCYFPNPKTKMGHFVGFLGGRIFAISEQSLDEFDSLRNFFEKDGEVLPILHEGKKYFVFNCTNCLQALDMDKSEITGAVISKHVFLPGVDGLFTTPERNELFCAEGVSDPRDEFKGYVEEQKLKGLMFEHLWSGDAP